jgi:hypothetical protein
MLKTKGTSGCFSLVIGCGTTSQRSLCRCSSLVAIDIDKKKLSIAKEKDPYAYYIVADACSLPFRKGCFWDVVCTDVLEHISSYGKVVREIGELCPRFVLLRFPTEVREKLLVKASRVYREQHWGKIHVTIVNLDEVVNILDKFGYKISLKLTSASSTFTRIILHGILEKLNIKYQIPEIGLVKFKEQKRSYEILTYFCVFLGLLMSLPYYVLWRFFRLKTIHDGCIVCAKG